VSLLLEIFLPGETVLYSVSEYISPERTIHTVQLDRNPDVHVEITAPGRLINHSCDPNTGVKDNKHMAFDFIALRSIKKGDEISFDYETTEYESIAVPKCLCGTPSCRGKTVGFKFHFEELINKYGDRIADYLKKKETQ